MKRLDLSSVPSDLKNLMTMSLSSLHDTLTSRSHSRDFAHARGDFLRNRSMVVGMIFLILLPFWALIDWFMLPAESARAALVARVLMLVILAVTVLMAHQSKARPQRARLATGLLFATPALFYALILATLSDGATSLIGYSFIPYMLVGMLAIFPFTLLESMIVGLALIVLQMYALFVNGTLMSAAGVQEIWLLAALLSLALTANYFQLGLMLRLYREATHDPLTGLLNRGALARALEQLSVNPESPKLALLMMDLDHFKRVNDTHGHAFGDDVLRNFAGILRRALRSTDLAARYGGEEFVAILMGVNKDAAIAIAERIRQQTETAILENYEGEKVNYTVSIGVATFQPGEHFQSVIIRADNRLYEAKKLSRNCVVGV